MMQGEKTINGAGPGREAAWRGLPLRLAAWSAFAFLPLVGLAVVYLLVARSGAGGPAGDGLVPVAMIALAAGLASVATLLVARHLVCKPVAAATDAATRLARGELQARVAPTARAGEMRELATAFNGAADALVAQIAALRASEARLKAVLATVREGIVVADPQGRLLHVNRAAAGMLACPSRGDTAAARRASGDLELSGPDGAAWTEDEWPLARVLRGEVLRDVEGTVHHRREGWRRELACDGALALDAQGRPQLAVLTLRDIAQRRQAEATNRAQLAQLRLLSGITRAMGQPRDVAAIYQTVVAGLEDALALAFAGVYLHDARSGRLDVACARKLAIARALAMEGEGEATVLLGRCLRGELVHEPDAGTSTLPLAWRLAALGLRSAVLAPMRAGDEVLGVVVAARAAARAFTEADCEFLRQVGEHVALAAQQARLHAALRDACDDLLRMKRPA